MNGLDYLVFRLLKKLLAFGSIGGYPFGLLVVIWVIQLPFGESRKGRK
ncbi:MAG: hypothetical protein AB2417_02465 [Clostridiaceae bacterium]